MVYVVEHDVGVGVQLRLSPKICERANCCTATSIE